MKRIWIYDVMQATAGRVEVACRVLDGDVLINDVFVESVREIPVIRVVTIEVYQRFVDILYNCFSGILVCDILSGDIPVAPSEYVCSELPRVTKTEEKREY